MAEKFFPLFNRPTINVSNRATALPVWWSNLNEYFKSGCSKEKRVIPNPQQSTLNKSSRQTWFLKQPPGKTSGAIKGTVPMPVKFVFAVTNVYVC